MLTIKPSVESFSVPMADANRTNDSSAKIVYRNGLSSENRFARLAKCESITNKLLRLGDRLQAVDEDGVEVVCYGIYL